MKIIACFISVIFVCLKQKEITLNPLFPKKGWTNGYYAYLIIAAIAIGIYLPTLYYSFSPLDDEWIIAKRFNLFFKFSSVKIFFSEAMLQTYYRPIWVSSHLVDTMIGGANPWIFHFFNAIYHAIANILLYKVFEKLQIESRVSLFLVLVFAVHPINVQSVAFIPGRTDILLGIFSFSSFIFFINYINSEKIKYSFLCALSFALALFTKESAIVIPFILVSYLVLLSQKKSLKKYRLFFLLLFSITFIWFFIRHAIIPVYPAITNGNILLTIKDALLALLLYIGKILLPINQAIMPTVSETPLLPYILVICFSCLMIWKLGFKDKKKVLFGIIWFVLFIGLSIIAGSTKGNGEHIEQRAYIPLAGILIIISQIDFSKSNLFSNARYSKLIVICLLLPLSIKTIMRSKVYANPYIMAQTAIQESPHQVYFYIVLGKIYLANNMPKEAIKWYDKYIEKYPNKSMPYTNKGVAYFTMKKFDEAIENYTKAIELSPNTSLIYIDRARAYCGLKMYDNALADIMHAKKLGERIDEDFEKEIENLLIPEKEIKNYTDNILSDTATSFSYNRRGIAYYTKGNYVDAIKDFSTARKLNPSDPICLINRGWIYETEGKLDSAHYDYKKLAEMGYPIGRNALENLKRKMNTSKTPKPSKNPER